MSMPPDDAGREAGGRPLPFAARWRTLRTAAPAWYAGTVLGLAIFAAVALVGRPAGAGLALLGAALCAVAAAPGGRDPWTVTLWLLAGSLALMPALRAAAWVWIPCLLGAVALASLAAAGGHSGRQVAAGLVRVLRLLPPGAIATIAPLGRAAGRADGDRLRPALRGGLLAAVLMAAFVPLFTSADPAFAELVGRALPSDLSVDAPFGRAVTLALVTALGGALLLVRRAGASSAGGAARPRLARAEWLVPLGCLVALFASFVAVQLAVLFGGHDHVLRTAGLSYADYAHEGYGQLMAAAALTLAVVAGAWRWARTPRRADRRLLRSLLAALCVFCLVVLASALERLRLYEEAFGYTRLRLLADANILWLGAVLALVLGVLATGRAGGLPRALVLVSAVGALVFAVTNPDGRIAARSVERYEAGRGIDARYLAALSPDAAEPLTRLREPECLVGRMLADLSRTDGLAGANVARARARDVLAVLRPRDRGCAYP